MNKPLLLEVAKYILKYPKKYDQMELCGSPCCIGGLSIFFKNPKLFKELSKHHGNNVAGSWSGKWHSESQYLLDLTDNQFDRLCKSSVYWPAKFSNLYDANSHDYKKRAKVAHDRIIHLIKTGK